MHYGSMSGYNDDSTQKIDFRSEDIIQEIDKLREAAFRTSEKLVAIQKDVGKLRESVDQLKGILVQLLGGPADQ
jgi:hypothetical protein